MILFHNHRVVSFCNSYKFVIPADGQWGAEKNKSGNWTGIVGDLQRKVQKVLNIRELETGQIFCVNSPSYVIPYEE